MAAAYDGSGFWEQLGAASVFGEMVEAQWREQGGYGTAGEEEFEAQAPSTPSPAPVPPPPPAPAPVVLASSAVLAPSPSSSVDSAVDLYAPASPLTASTYKPLPHILAHNPAAPHDPNSLYAPITTSRFRNADEAAAHRRRARLAPKNRAADVARVKAFGRDYWVCRLFNAMINSADITDGEASIHRARFTTKAAFDAVDLEAAAHAVFDEAIAVHERGWNRPKVYHKRAVRGKLVDTTQTSVELRLSRICVVLQQTKSAVDDAVRGGVTMALLCDNPEARNFTKRANDLGNAKRGERLRETATKEKAKARGDKKPKSEVEVGEQEPEPEQDVGESVSKKIVEEFAEDGIEDIAEVAEVAKVEEGDEFAEFFNFDE